eukprot:gene9231-11454_t
MVRSRSLQVTDSASTKQSTSIRLTAGHYFECIMASSSSGSEDEWGQANSDEEGEEIQIEFDSVACVEDDFHRIKPLLRQLMKQANVDASSITDLILAQPHVGAVVKVAVGVDGKGNASAAADVAGAADAAAEAAELETVYGVTTLLNLKTHA